VAVFYMQRAIEETGPSADYGEVTAACARIAPLFERADAIQVTFSTEDTCYYDASDHKTVFQDGGLLHPRGGIRFANRPHFGLARGLPAGGV